MTALELNADNAALSDTKGHGVNHSPWGYHATTVGGRKNKTKGYKNKHKKGGKSNKNKRRSKYTRQKQNKTRKQRK
jgi:hypothetical protein